MTERIIADVNAELLKLVLPAMAKNDVRYYLNGIHLAPAANEGTLMVATNGHFIALCHDKEGAVDQPITVRVDSLLAKHMKASNRLKVLASSASGKKGRAIITDSHGAEASLQPGNAIIDGMYPDWRRLFPAANKLTPGFPGTVNADYLKPFMVSISSRGGSAKLRVWSTGDENQIMIVRNDTVPEFVGGIMPVRADVKTPYPDGMGLDEKGGSDAAF